jgi:hypothetical protein
MLIPCLCAECIRPLPLWASLWSWQWRWWCSGELNSGCWQAEESTSALLQDANYQLPLGAETQQLLPNSCLARRAKEAIKTPARVLAFLSPPSRLVASSLRVLTMQQAALLAMLCNRRLSALLPSLSCISQASRRPAKLRQHRYSLARTKSSVARLRLPRNTICPQSAHARPATLHYLVSKLRSIRGASPSKQTWGTPQPACSRKIYPCTS